jgi:orotidine-5'-phosphate decarboxylase
MSTTLVAEPVVSVPKTIPAHERLIVPLDVPTFDEAMELVEKLGDSVHFYKLGLELLLAGGGFTGKYVGMVDWLVDRQKKVMVDLKIFDIARTVRAAVQQLTGHHATFVTVHGTDEIFRAAAEVKNGVKVLAVTVLTSFDQGDMEALGFQANIRDVVLSRAKRALAAGCDGVIASGEEVADLRQTLGAGVLIVVPGIRAGENREIPAMFDDDQKRVSTVERAFEHGADYIIVGRPIRKALDPRAEAQLIQQHIAALFP